MLWSYWGRRGEKSWNQDFNKCKGRMQSPIDINTNELVKDATMQIDYINYDLELTNAILLNSGHGGISFMLNFLASILQNKSHK